MDPVPKRARNAHSSGPGSAALCNSLSTDLAARLFAEELSHWSKTSTRSRCTVSTRSLAVGQYARCTIEGRHLSAEYADLPSSKRRVNVSHLALRSRGMTLPIYGDNIDVTHSCHNGRAGVGTLESCITPEHLSLDTHANNMRQQNCPTQFTCSFCRLVSPCAHGCVPATELDQRRPCKVVIHYEDGTTVTVTRSSNF